MATYATYRHIELDKVGKSKKRVRNPPSDIFNVLCTPTKAETNGTITTPSPRRSHNNNDSFTRLFGTPDVAAPRRASLTKPDATTRNPVTGNGVDSWDCKPKVSPKVHTERNPVTGEVYTIISPATTPTKPSKLSFPKENGNAPQLNGNHVPIINGNLTNGQA